MEELEAWSNLALLNEHTRLTREGFNNLNPIGRSESYLSLARRNARVREILISRLTENPREP